MKIKTLSGKGTRCFLERDTRCIFYIPNCVSQNWKQSLKNIIIECILSQFAIGSILLYLVLQNGFFSDLVARIERFLV